MKIKKYTYYKDGDYHHYYEGKNGLHIYHGLVNWYNNLLNNLDIYIKKNKKVFG